MFFLACHDGKVLSWISSGRLICVVLLEAWQDTRGITLMTYLGLNFYFLLTNFTSKNGQYILLFVQPWVEFLRQKYLIFCMVHACLPSRVIVVEIIIQANIYASWLKCHNMRRSHFDLKKHVSDWSKIVWEYLK